jgi:hypothetical protein
MTSHFPVTCTPLSGGNLDSYLTYWGRSPSCPPCLSGRPFSWRNGASKVSPPLPINSIAAPQNQGWSLNANSMPINVGQELELIPYPHVSCKRGIRQTSAIFGPCMLHFCRLDNQYCDGRRLYEYATRQPDWPRVLALHRG